MSTTELRAKESKRQEMVLPFVLIATGLILLAGDRFGFLSLDRIQNFWPVAIILVGLAESISYSDAGGR
jgi:hypothetical protein